MLSVITSTRGMAFVRCLEFRGCPYKIYAVNAAIGRGHVACMLYGGCPLVQVSIIGFHCT